MKSIKHMRTILEWSQKDLADMSGISRSHLCEIENGKKSPSIAAVEEIAKAMGLEGWHLLYLESYAHSVIETVQCLDVLERL